MSDRKVKRSYHSPARERAAVDTRRRIRVAAAERFVREGFSGTSMKAIAADAQVSERTVFLAFPTKAALLAECIRVAVRGGDDDVPLLARQDSRRIFDAPPELMLRAVAEQTTDLLDRAARLLAVGESVGPDDPLIAVVRERGRAATRADMLDIAKAMKRAGAVRRGVSARRAAEVMYALAASESVYLRLTGHCGWTSAEYATFLEQALTGAIGNRDCV